MTLTGGGLFAFVSTHPAITLIGSGSACRLYPRRLPQMATLPAVVYRRISTPREMTHSGPDGLPTPRIQLDVWAKTPDEADAVAEQLRIALDGFRGAMGGVEVGSVRVVNDADDDEPDSGLYRRILDLEISHREAVA